MGDDFEALRIRDLVFFDRVATLESITGAAKELEIPPATASRWLATLEKRAGMKLINRTTRRVALNDRGQAFHIKVRRALAALQAARSVLQEAVPRGTLRVSVPVPLGRALAGQLIARYRQELPEVRLEIRFENERVDLIRERVDVVIRGGPLQDSSLIARPLGQVALWLYASAAYRDAAPEDIPLIASPGDVALLGARGWPGLSCAAVVDDRASLAEALKAGAGLGILPAFLGEPARQRGTLYRMHDAPLIHFPVNALFLPAMKGDVRVKALIHQVHELLGEIVVGGDS